MLCFFFFLVIFSVKILRPKYVLDIKKKCLKSI